MTRPTEGLGAHIPAAHLLDRCPHCQGADDWYPDPSGPNCETWLICGYCGLMLDDGNKVVQAGEPSRWEPEPVAADDDDEW